MKSVYTIDHKAQEMHGVHSELGPTPVQTSDRYDNVHELMAKQGAPRMKDDVKN